MKLHQLLKKLINYNLKPIASYKNQEVGKMKPEAILTEPLTFNLKPLTLISERSKAMKTKIFFAGLLFAVIFLASFSYSQVPQMINYQGTLTDDEGNPITDNLDMTFSIWDALTEGNQLWTETQNGVAVENGVFSVLLGRETVGGIPFDVFNGDIRFLEVKIADDPPMVPRREIVSVAYAYRAGNSHWSVTDSVLYTNNYWGLARGGAGNVLYGDSAHTMVNLGVACTTGISWHNCYYSTISGGYGNVSSWKNGTVGGGVYNAANGCASVVGGGYANRVEGGYSAILGGYADTITAEADWSYLFGIGSKLTEDSTFMVDMPHIWFGDEANGYEFPTSDGASGQVIATDGSGQLSWVNVSGGGGGWVDEDTIVKLQTSTDYVGIGTNDPQYKLDVEGNIHASGSIKSGNSLDLQGNLYRLVTSNGEMYFGRDPATGDFDDVIVGIGTMNPGVMLDVAGEIQASENIFFQQNSDAVIGFNYPDNTRDKRMRITAGKEDGPNVQNKQGACVDLHGNDCWGDFGLGELHLVAGSAGGRILFYTGDPVDLAMCVTSDGDVGIGTIDPLWTLDVQGEIRARDRLLASNDDGAIALTPHLTYSEINAQRNTPLQPANIALATTGGNVGIGTTTPWTPLHVIRENPGGNQLMAEFWNPSDDAGTGVSINLGIGTTAPRGWRLRVTEASLHLDRIGAWPPAMAINNLRYVGIGTTEPQRQLHLHQTSTGASVFHITNSATGSGINDGFDIGVIQNTGEGMIWNRENAGIRIGTNNQERVWIKEDGRVGIGTGNPQGALDVNSTTGAFIVPRMTTAQRNALIAVNGMIIYNTTTNQFNFRENGAWVIK